MNYRNQVKRILQAIGLYDPCSSTLGISRLRETDTFLVSYPRSGNTWMRFLIANAVSRGMDVSHDDLNDYVPDIHGNANRVNRMRDPRIIKTHGVSFECYPRWIYMVRDGRDALTSFYYYTMLRKKFRGSFSEFLLSRRAWIFGNWSWAGHVRQAMEAQDRSPDRCLLIKYEDVLLDPGSELQRALEFIGIEAEVETINMAVERSDFQNLQKAEEREAKPEGENNRIFRKGAVGEWKKVFSTEDEEYFMRDAKPLLERLGYL